MTLTAVGDEWQTVRARIARVRYRIVQSTGRPLDWAWTVEGNPRGTGHHVHAAKRGKWLKWEVFEDAIQREGVGHVGWLSPAKEVDGPERYLTKYLTKGVASWGSYLALNGGRLMHTSRGFWLDDDGLPVTWRKARAGDGTWIRVLSLPTAV